MDLDEDHPDLIKWCDERKDNFNSLNSASEEGQAGLNQAPPLSTQVSEGRKVTLDKDASLSEGKSSVSNEDKQAGLNQAPPLFTRVIEGRKDTLDKNVRPMETESSSADGRRNKRQHN